MEASGRVRRAAEQGLMRADPGRRVAGCDSVSVAIDMAL